MASQPTFDIPTSNEPSPLHTSVPIRSHPSKGKGNTDPAEAARLAKLHELERRRWLLGSEQSFTPTNLRRLFRIMDTDNNHQLSHQEFMQG
jgi:hypothetical protein